MKKVFNKLNKIMFAVGLVSLITLVLITVNSTGTITDGIWGVVFRICLIGIFVFAIFTVISVVLAVMEGLKKDKAAFLKKFIVNVVWITIAYIVVCSLDFYCESICLKKFEIGEIVLRIFITVLALTGGEYMLTGHSKEKEEISRTKEYS